MVTMTSNHSSLVSSSAFLHDLAVVESGVSIGARTRIWAFAHVLPGAVIGEDCNICDHTFVEGRVRIGDRVTVKCGVYLWDGVIVEDDVFIGPAAAFTNDMRPRSRQYLKEHPLTFLRNGSSIGANATILPGVEIGRWAMVGAGAVVTRSVPDHGLVVGNPARLMGWVCRCGERLQIEGEADTTHCECGCMFGVRRGIEGQVVATHPR